MQSNLFYKLFVAYALILVFACSVDKKEIKKENSLAVSTIENDLSSFAIPIQLELEDVQKIINTKLKKKLVSNKRIAHNVVIDVDRAGQIRLSGYKNQLRTSIPIRVKAKKKGKLFRKLKTDFILRVDLLSDFVIDENWKIRSKSSISSLNWIEKPKVKVLGLDIDINKLIENELRKKNEELSALVDRAIANQVNLKDKLEPIWQKLQKPHNIIKNTGESLFLSIRPVSTSYESHQITDTLLIVNLRSDAYFDILSSDPTSQKIITELPPLISSNTSGTGFDLAIKAELDFDSINSTIQSLLRVQNEINVEGYTISLDDAKISASGQNLLVELDIGGAVSGKIEGFARIYNDSIHHNINIDLLHLEVKQGDIELELANVVFGDFLDDYVEEYGGFNYKSTLEKIPHYIQKGISKGKSGDKWHPIIDDMDIQIHAMELTNKAIVIQAKGSGGATIQIDRLN